MSAYDHLLESLGPPADRLPTPDELAGWKSMIRQMPDVRHDKVQAVRDALESNQYDEHRYLDHALDAISRELSAS